MIACDAARQFPARPARPVKPAADIANSLPQRFSGGPGMARQPFVDFLKPQREHAHIAGEKRIALLKPPFGEQIFRVALSSPDATESSALAARISARVTASVLRVSTAASSWDSLATA